MAVYRGKRRGLSLVEMLIAVILFGVMSMIGYKYYKNFFSTGDIVKKSQIGSLIDQASQLSNAYDIYQMQFGQVPESEQNLTQGNVMILAKIPEGMPEITGDQNASKSWLLAGDENINATAGDTDVAFYYPVAKTSDGKRVCQVFNNIMDQSRDLNSTIPTDLRDGYSNVNKTAFCANVGTVDGSTIKANENYIVFVKTIND
jgi:prepilin-type N-terminal cleavage/methylation domain-containing protein